MSLPYFTGDFPGIGGSIKQRAADFFVQEVPLYEPSGQGEHVFCEIQKVGITTFEAIDRLAQALNVSTRDIGFAGMKDARAVTQQVLSIWGTTEEAVMNAKVYGVTVQWAARHVNKLRLGHLAGNRFAVKIRDVNPTDVVKIEPLLETLQRRGIPNYFGEQRFGMRGNNDQLGAALVRGDFEGLLKLLLGSPDKKLDDPKTRAAREAFDAGKRDDAMRLWPRRGGMERRVLARLIKTRKVGSAVLSIDEKLRRLWVTALQSRLFNEVLSKRLAQIDQVMDGDWAIKHENGACFPVTDAMVEQPRVTAFEISPTGPLAGYRMSLPTGEPLNIEQAVFSGSHLSLENFRVPGRLKVKGARRALRVQPKNVELAAGVDEHGAHITIAFTLPPGSFATVLLREVMKNDGLHTHTTQEAEPDAEDQDALENIDEATSAE